MFVAGLGVVELDFDTTTESVLDRIGPAWSFYERSVADFGGDEVVVLAIEGENPYELGVLRDIERLTSLAEGFEGVRRVDSLSTFPLIRSGPNGDLLLDAGMADGPPTGRLGTARLAELVSRDRIGPRTLVSDDGRVHAVNIFLEAGSSEAQDELLAQIDSVLEPGRAWTSGVPVFRTRVNQQTEREILRFVPLTVAAIAALVSFAFWAPKAAIVSLLTSGFGSWITLGTMGWVGTPLTISTMMLPSVLLALGSAYVMHVLSAAQGASERGEIGRRIAHVAVPIALSGLTTAIGLVALSTIRIQVVRDFGGYGALGVLSVLVAALSLSPALLAVTGGSSSAPAHRLLRERGASWLSSFAQNRPGTILIPWVVAILVSVVGIRSLEVETDAIVWFSKESRVRVAYEEIKSHLAGISPMNVVIEGQELTRPAVLGRIEKFGRFLHGLPEVGKVISVVDPLAQAHAAFQGGSADELPDSREAIEQYLLLLESVEYLGDVISEDRTRANVILRVDNNGSEDLMRIARAAESWWAREGHPETTARTTGIMYEFARSEHELAWGQIRGLSLALAAIGLVLFAIFRWPLLVGAALVPNVIPLVLVFGAMGLLRIPLDAITVGVGSTALGIAVDDTIHLVTAFQRGISSGSGNLSALNRALAQVLPPLVFTTAAVMIGFGVLGFSDFTVTRNLGIVTAAVVGICLLADLTLLPLLLSRLPRQEGAPAGTLGGEGVGSRQEVR